MAPGKGGAVGGVVGDRGEVLIGPQDMANHLRKHWAEFLVPEGSMRVNCRHGWMRTDSIAACRGLLIIRRRDFDSENVPCERH